MTEYNDLVNMLLEEKRELESYLKSLKKSFSSFPKGYLEIHQKNDHYVQFYVHTSDNRRIYIPKKKENIARQLAQKSYNEKIIGILEKRLYHIEMLLKQYSDSIHSPYTNLTAARRSLINPIILTDEEFIAEWYENNPGSQNPYEFINTFLGFNNEQVRSKSEALLTNTFAKLGIPYVYEPKLELSDGSTLFPDFKLLNVRLRKTYIHEHFGMMDDPEYATQCIRKINMYNKNGYIIGENFLCSFESRNSPYDLRAIKNMLSLYLL